MNTVIPDKSQAKAQVGNLSQLVRGATRTARIAAMFGWDVTILVPEACSMTMLVTCTAFDQLEGRRKGAEVLMKHEYIFVLKTVTQSHLGSDKGTQPQLTQFHRIC